MIILINHLYLSDFYDFGVILKLFSRGIEWHKNHYNPIDILLYDNFNKSEILKIHRLILPLSLMNYFNAINFINTHRIL